MVLIKLLMFLVVIKHSISTDLILSAKQRHSLVMVPCDIDNDCEELGGTCVESFCHCNGSTVCSDKSRLVVTKIGERCEAREDCNIENGFCHKGKCACKEGLVASSNFKRCLKVSEGLDGECEENVQCRAATLSSACQENKCSCQQHMFAYNGSCYKIVDLGYHCEIKEECYKTQHTRCVKARCSCVDGFVASGSRCLPVAKGLEGACTEEVQCVAVLGEGSECINGFCQCRELFQVKNSTGKCVKDMLLGDKCDHHSDCHQPGHEISRLECILGECKCKPTYTQQDGYCLNSSSSVAVTVYLLTVIFASMLF